MGAIETGSEVAGLRIERELGRGSCGRVFLARDAVIGRAVAVKVIHAPHGAEEARRALREARGAGRINSPYVVTLHRAIPLEEQDVWLLEMEYVAGGSLKERLGERGTLPPAQALEITRDVLRALQAAHEAGVVHGDVKPANLLLEPSGAVKLADFGLSWTCDDTRLNSSISEGVAGTPAYMAPEVIMGDRVRAGADLWSVGVLLHRMLTGAPPFPTQSLRELFLAIQNDPPAPLPDDLPALARELVAGLLRKDPHERIPSASAALQRFEEPMPMADAPETPRTPLFGRDKELALLEARLATAMQGAGAFVLLHGEAGVGKTALLRRFAEHARAQELAVIEVSASALDGLLRPLFDASRHLAGDAVQANGARTRQQMGWAVEQLLSGLASAGGVVVVIDNVHVAPAEEIAVLRELARRLRLRPALVIASARSHDTELPGASGASTADGLAAHRELAALEGVVEMQLGALAPAAILELLLAESDGVRLARDVAQRVVAAADGNPLLALEYLRHLEEAGEIERDGSTLRPSGTWRSGGLPPRFQEVVEQRLAGLDETARALLDAAAVDGRRFRGAAVQAVLDQPLLPVLRGLQKLYRQRRLIEPDGDEFRFSSRVTHEVIYRGVAPALRRELHRGLAAYYERADVECRAERLAQHWELAGEPERARPYLLAAATIARERQDNERAIDLLERAGLRAGEANEERVAGEPSAYYELARALAGCEQQEQAERIFGLVARGAQDASLRLVADVHGARMAYLRAGPDAVDEAAVQRAVEATGDGEARAEALYLRGVIAKRRGELPAAQEFMAEAAEVDARGEFTERRAAIVHQLASLALREERLEDAERLFGEASGLYEALGRRGAALASEVNAVLARVHRGELEGTESRLRHAFLAFQLESSLGSAAHTAALLSQVQYARGDLAGATTTLAQALDWAVDVGSLVVQLQVRQCHAQLLFVQGRMQAAFDELARASEDAERAGDAGSTLLAICVEAQARVCVGDTRAAARLAVQASELATAGAERANLVDAWSWLGEGVAFGLPVSALPRTSADDPFRVWRDGLVAWANPQTDPAPIQYLVDVLAGALPGWRRAPLDLWRRALAVEAGVRRGEEMVGAAESALDAAERLGHVWWEAYWLRCLGSLTRDAYYEERLDELLVRLARALPDATMQRRLMAQWASRGSV